MDQIRDCQMLIDGDWVAASDGATFDSTSPISGTPWARIPEATGEDVDRAVRAADRAFTAGPWASMTPSQRGKCLRKLGDLLAEKSEELGRAETIDTGKMLKETRWQAKYIAEFFHFYAGAADKLSGEVLPIDKPDLFVFSNREPLGVVAAVVPWNSQLFLTAVKIGPALAAGNTVVLKASEHASVAMLDFGRLIAEAGFPKGVVNIVTGHNEVGRVLTSHPLVARVSFTGGPNAARAIVRNRRQLEPQNVYLRFLEALAMHKTGANASDAASLLVPLPRHRWHQGEAAVIASILASSGQIDRSAPLAAQIDPAQLFAEEKSLFTPWQARFGMNAEALVGSVGSE